MSSRFHNKFHRFNHHSIKDPSIPDAGYDPIASTESPFRGEFILSGYLSAFNPQGEHSIITDNIFAFDTIRSTNMFVTSSLTAEDIVVHFIDVKYSETSGFAMKGSDFSINIPLVCPRENTLILSGIGLSATSWVSFGGNVNIGNNLIVSGGLGTSIISTNNLYPLTPYTYIWIPSANFDSVHTRELTASNIQGNNVTIQTANISTLNVDVVDSYNNTHVDYNTDIHLTNGYAISGAAAHFTDIYGTNYYGLTTNNLQIYVTQGWKPIDVASVTNYVPQFTNWKYSLDNNTNHTSLSTDTMIIVNISAVDYRAYGELEGVVNGQKVAGARVGNIGNLPNSNVEHASKAGLWLDNETSFTFIAPSGQSWSVNTLSGFYDSLNADANINVGITIYQQNLINLSFAGSDFSLQNMSLNGCLSTDCIHPYTPNNPINIWSDVDFHGHSLSGIGNSSLHFESGAIISSNTSGDLNLLTNNKQITIGSVSSRLVLQDNLLSKLDDGIYIGNNRINRHSILENIGNNWTAKDTSRSWISICMSSDGKYQSAVVIGGQIYISSDYGNTWVAKDSSRDWNSICMSADGKYQSACVSNNTNGRIYISSDYGNTWVAKESFRLWYSICMSADGKYQTVVVNGGQIYISSDYGNTWVAKDSNRDWYTVSMSSDGKYQSAVFYGGQIYISSDYGNTWVAKDSNRVWNSIDISSDGKYQSAVVYNDKIYISSDYGNTWVAKDSNRLWYGICMSADGKYQAAIENGGQIYISTDYGNTWVAKGSSLNWYAICMSADGKYQSAVVDSGQIYISKGDEVFKGNVNLLDGTTYINSLSANGNSLTIEAPILNFTNSAMTSADGIYYSSGLMLTITLAGSTLYLPLFKG